MSSIDQGGGKRRAQLRPAFGVTPVTGLVCPHAINSKRGGSRVSVREQSILEISVRGVVQISLRRNGPSICRTITSCIYGRATPADIGLRIRFASRVSRRTPCL